MEDKSLAEFHKKQAIDCFNQTWDLIDLTDRTPQQDLEMAHKAHTSRYHWGIVGQPLHWERGEWLISKVYYLLGSGERALAHAKACHDICVDQSIGDFDITFAYEALANAYKLLDQPELAKQYKQFGLDSLAGIENEADRSYAEAEINKI